MDVQRRKASRKRKSDPSQMVRCAQCYVFTYTEYLQDVRGISEALNAMVLAGTSEDTDNDADCKQCHRPLYRKILEDFLTANAEQ